MEINSSFMHFTKPYPLLQSLFTLLEALYRPCPSFYNNLPINPLTLNLNPIATRKNPINFQTPNILSPNPAANRLYLDIPRVPDSSLWILIRNDRPDCHLATGLQLDSPTEQHLLAGKGLTVYGGVNYSHACNVDLAMFIGDLHGLALHV